MTKEEFELQLNKIGWKIIKSHNGLNDKLASMDNKIITDIRVNNDSLEPFSNHLYGGSSFNILAKWYFKNVNILDDGSIAMNHLIIIKRN